MLDKPSSKVGVRTMQEEIGLLAGPRDWGETRERWLERAANKLANVPYRMVKSLFYGEITDDKHWAAIELRETVARIKAQREAAAFANQIESIIGGLRATDEDFHGPAIAALSITLGKLRGLDSA